MSVIHSPSNRRHFLRGLGALVSLPVLESLIPKAAAAAGSSPVRMAFLYIPNGVNVEKWRCTGEGRNWNLGQTLGGLGSYKNDIQVITGLAHRKAANNGDGAGDHARANSTFLTGVQLKKTNGSDIRAGISVDQVAASKIGTQTRLPSLELSTDGVRNSGNCDSGYSCAYQYNLSWRGPSTPNSPEMNPKAVFDRLFGGNSPKEVSESDKRRRALSKSILDFVADDAKTLNKNLSRNDQTKLDEYLTSVRETERRIESAVVEAPKDFKAPDGVPGEYQVHIRSMFDLLTLAFQTDSTRIATFLMAHDGSNRNFRDIGVSDAHHSISHHGRDPDKMEKIAKIDKFYAEQLGYFLGKLKGIQENGRSLLDQCMIVYGGGISDGDRHNHDDLPVILAGKGGGALHPGQHLVLPQEVPMTNLYLSMLDIMGAPTDSLGDSTGRMKGM